jgi:hypothetical protein
VPSIRDAIPAPLHAVEVSHRAHSTVLHISTVTDTFAVQLTPAEAALLARELRPRSS